MAPAKPDRVGQVRTGRRGQERPEETGRSGYLWYPDPVMGPRMNGYRSSPSGSASTLRQRTAELIGGPLDGLTIGQPLEPYAHFIFVPTDGSFQGPCRVHTYTFVPTLGRYRYWQ